MLTRSCWKCMFFLLHVKFPQYLKAALMDIFENEVNTTLLVEIKKAAWGLAGPQSQKNILYEGFHYYLVNH